MRYILSFLLTLLMLLPAIAQQPPTQRKGNGTEKTETMKVGGTDRKYVSYVPQDLGAKRPLLIACHGMNQNTDWMKGYMDLQPIADTAKFVAVFPQGIDNSWDISGKKDINYILKIIDVMVENYDVDPGRVYLSGFSMGGMLTYHAMNLIPDRIAAFAPISGYTMGGVTANANVRSIPIIHTHGTSDDVVTFSNVKSNLNKWIQHNGCPSTAQVSKNYRGTSHITRHVWGPGDDDVYVVLMELAGKGHWVSNDYVWTADEIWKFCSQYKLDVEWPIVKPQLEPDQKFTSMSSIGSKPVAIINEIDQKALFGSSAQNLGYEDYETSFDENNSGYQFKLLKTTGGYRLRLMTPEGAEYNIWGKPGYLNSQSTGGNCCFILGIAGQSGNQSSLNGEDIKNGAVWDIQYEEEKGWSLKNVGTGKYLRNNDTAKYDDPTYFTFCTLKEKTETGIEDVRYRRDDVKSGVYTLDGRRANAENLRPGMYIVNGKKIVIK